MMNPLPEHNMKTTPINKVNPFNKETNGIHEWTALAGDMYMATGKDRNGKRFNIKSHSWMYIRGINVWRGSKWLLRDGRRWLIQRITN